jgi:outer membrane protein TolC
MSLSRRSFIALLVIVFSTSCFSWAQQLTFQHAIELAVQHSPAVGMAVADQLKARGAYQELLNQRKPNVTFGSGVGYSYGFPLTLEGSAPAIFNVNYYSSVYSFAGEDYKKSAKLEWNAAQTSTEDQRKDVILETALDYIQLDKLNGELKHLGLEQNDAGKLVAVVEQRVQQGVDSQVELNRAKLMAARAQMQIAQIEGTMDVLRTQLSQLTGLPVEAIVTDSDSIPKFPEVDQNANLATQALANSTTVKAADQRAVAESFRAKAEWKASYYPSFDLAAQYGLFSNALNNYESFFKTFQRNNASFGLVIRLPILNFVQHAKADEAAADALKAQKQAEQVKNQVSTQTLQLQRTVRQLAAAEQVAQLEYQIAQSEAQATEIRAQQGTPAPAEQGQAAQAVSPRDVGNAHLQAGDKYAQYIDASFQLEKARLQLLRATGELESWASGK